MALVSPGHQPKPDRWRKPDNHHGYDDNAVDEGMLCDSTETVSAAIESAARASETVLFKALQFSLERGRCLPTSDISQLVHIINSPIATGAPQASAVQSLNSSTEVDHENEGEPQDDGGMHWPPKSPRTGADKSEEAHVDQPCTPQNLGEDRWTTMVNSQVVPRPASSTRHSRSPARRAVSRMRSRPGSDRSMPRSHRRRSSRSASRSPISMVDSSSKLNAVVPTGPSPAVTPEPTNLVPISLELANSQVVAAEGLRASCIVAVENLMSMLDRAAVVKSQLDAQWAAAESLVAIGSILLAHLLQALLPPDDPKLHPASLLAHGTQGPFRTDIATMVAAVCDIDPNAVILAVGALEAAPREHDVPILARAWPVSAGGDIRRVRSAALQLRDIASAAVIWPVIADACAVAGDGSAGQPSVITQPESGIVAAAAAAIRSSAEQCCYSVATEALHAISAAWSSVDSQVSPVAGAMEAVAKLNDDTATALNSLRSILSSLDASESAVSGAGHGLDPSDLPHRLRSWASRACLERVHDPPGNTAARNRLPFTVTSPSSADTVLGCFRDACSREALVAGIQRRVILARAVCDDVPPPPPPPPLSPDPQPVAPNPVAQEEPGIVSAVGNLHAVGTGNQPAAKAQRQEPGPRFDEYEARIRSRIQFMVAEAAAARRHVALHRNTATSSIILGDTRSSPVPLRRPPSPELGSTASPETAPSPEQLADAIDFGRHAASPPSSTLFSDESPTTSHIAVTPAVPTMAELDSRMHHLELLLHPNRRSPAESHPDRRSPAESSTVTPSSSPAAKAVACGPASPVTSVLAAPAGQGSESPSRASSTGRLSSASLHSAAALDLIPAAVTLHPLAVDAAERSAVAIQAVCRGAAARRELARRRGAVIRIQAAARGRIIRRAMASARETGIARAVQLAADVMRAAVAVSYRLDRLPASSTSHDSTGEGSVEQCVNEERAGEHQGDMAATPFSTMWIGTPPAATHNSPRPRVRSPPRGEHSSESVNDAAVGPSLMELAVGKRQAPNGEDPNQAIGARDRPAAMLPTASINSVLGVPGLGSIELAALVGTPTRVAPSPRQATRPAMPRRAHDVYSILQEQARAGRATEHGTAARDPPPSARSIVRFATASLAQTAEVPLPPPNTVSPTAVRVVPSPRKTLSGPKVSPIAATAAANIQVGDVLVSPSSAQMDRHAHPKDDAGEKPSNSGTKTPGSKLTNAAESADGVPGHVICCTGAGAPAVEAAAEESRAVKSQLQESRPISATPMTQGVMPQLAASRASFRHSGDVNSTPEATNGGSDIAVGQAPPHAARSAAPILRNGTTPVSPPLALAQPALAGSRLQAPERASVPRGKAQSASSARIRPASGGPDTLEGIVSSPASHQPTSKGPRAPPKGARRRPTLPKQPRPLLEHPRAATMPTELSDTAPLVQAEEPVFISGEVATQSNADTMTPPTPAALPNDGHATADGGMEGPSIRSQSLDEEAISSTVWPTAELQENCPAPQVSLSPKRPPTIMEDAEMRFTGLYPRESHRDVRETEPQRPPSILQASQSEQSSSPPAAATDSNDTMLSPAESPVAILAPPPHSRPPSARRSLAIESLPPHNAGSIRGGSSPLSRPPLSPSRTSTSREIAFEQPSMTPPAGSVSNASDSPPPTPSELPGWAATAPHAVSDAQHADQVSFTAMNRLNDSVADLQSQHRLASPASSPPRWQEAPSNALTRTRHGVLSPVSASWVRYGPQGPHKTSYHVASPTPYEPQIVVSSTSVSHALDSFGRPRVVQRRRTPHSPVVRQPHNVLPQRSLETHAGFDDDGWQPMGLTPAPRPLSGGADLLMRLEDAEMANLIDEAYSAGKHGEAGASSSKTRRRTPRT